MNVTDSKEYQVRVPPRFLRTRTLRAYLKNHKLNKEMPYNLWLQCNHNEKRKCNFNPSGRLCIQKSRGDSRRIKRLRDDEI